MGRRPVFEAKNLFKSFGSNNVLKGITLKIEQGEVLGLIGASGSGKTTLLNLLVGFLRPDRGSVLYFQYDKKGRPHIYNVLQKPLIVNKGYGFASQVPSFYETLTVRENLEYFGRMYDLGSHALKINIDILLRLMGLKASQYVMSSDLSGGMKRRLDIACAMVHNPSTLILDEPTSDLDPVLRNQIWEVVKRINMRGTTIILSSHHLNELDTLCSRIGIVKDGKLIDLDTPEKLKMKYSKEQEILVETFPGNYDKMAEKLKRLNVTRIAQQGTYILLCTEEPERIIKELLTVIEKVGEQLLDIKLNKPNLDDVFVQVYNAQSNTITHELESTNDQKNKVEDAKKGEKESGDKSTGDFHSNRFGRRTR